jgi:predicted RNA binding protein YcfA (HicA-like mRNA interferase family)
MSSTPSLTAREVMRALQPLGFVRTRSRGSHHRFEHPDGCKTTVPVHRGRTIPRGLLHQIVTVDVAIGMDEFLSML